MNSDFPSSGAGGGGDLSMIIPDLNQILSPDNVNTPSGS